MTTKEFISQYLKKHAESDNKVFPDDFVPLSSFDTIKLNCKSAVIGKEMFGQIEILSTDGETVFLADDIYRAKYIVYCNRNSNNDVKIPKEQNEVRMAVINYEKYLDRILADIREQAKQSSLDLANLHSISNEIFLKLNLIRY